MAYRGQFFKTLRAFCQVAEQGSIVLASETLHISQPALSLQIKALEETMGVLLFERNGPKLHITPDGEQLYLLARPLVEAVERLPQTFQEAKGDIDHGEVRLIASNSVLLYPVPEIIHIFQARYPNIRLHLQAVIARDIPELLLHDQADIAFGSLLDDHQYEYLQQEPVYRFSPMLLLPADHPLAVKSRSELHLADIVRYKLIVPPEYSYTWQMLRLLFAQHQLEYQVAVIASSNEVAKRCVAEGLGLAILTGSSFVDDPNLRTVPFDRFIPPRSYSIIVRRGKLLTPQAGQFRAAIMDWAERHHSDEA